MLKYFRLFLLFLPTFLSAQDQDTTFISLLRGIVSSSSEADRYVLSSDSAEIQIRKRYTLEHQLISIVNYKEDVELAQWVKHGSYTSYFPNGQIKSSGHYENDQKIGVWQFFYESGQNRGAVTINPEGIEEEATFFNEEGEAIILTATRQEAGYPGGMRGYVQFISERVEYPQLAQENVIEGTVIVAILVDESGKPIDWEVVKSVHPLLDEETLRVVKQIESFIPGKAYNLLRPTIFKAPITFKLLEPTKESKKKKKRKG